MKKRTTKSLTRKVKQTGTTNLKIDRKRKALPPGKRISKSGNVYNEYRKNRSDVTGYDAPMKRKSTRSVKRKPVRTVLRKSVIIDVMNVNGKPRLVSKPVSPSIKEANDLIVRNDELMRQPTTLVDNIITGNIRIYLFKADGRSSISRSISPTMKRLTSAQRYPIQIKGARYLTNHLSGEDLYDALIGIKNNRNFTIHKNYLPLLKKDEKDDIRRFLRMNFETRKLRKFAYYPISLLKLRR